MSQFTNLFSFQQWMIFSFYFKVAALISVSYVNSFIQEHLLC